jgi:hypothetical protein
MRFGLEIGFEVRLEVGLEVVLEVRLKCNPKYYGTLSLEKVICYDED